MPPGGGAVGSAGGISILLTADTSEYMRSVGRAERRAKQAEGSIEDLDQKSRNLKRGFAVAATGAAAFTAALGGLVNRYGKVDETFARIQSRAQISDEKLQQMRTTANELGAELPSTLSDSAQTLDELTKSGFTADQAMQSLRGSTILALAGQLEMAEAAGVTTSALSAWNLEAARANSIADALASTSSSTRAEVRGVGEALSYASSTASQVGASAEEISAWAGVLSTAGQEGTRAGTGIRQALNSIIDPTEKAKSALDSVGLSVQDFYDESGQLRDIQTIIDMLNSSMSDLNSHERSQLLSQVFGIRGQSAIAPLLSESENLPDFEEVHMETLKAEAEGALNRINKLNGTELQSLQTAVGFQLRRGSTEDVLKQFREQAKKQDWSQAELQSRLAEGLQISDESATRLAVDVGGEGDIGRLAEILDSTATAGKQADAVMGTLTGKIEALTGAADQFGANMFAGAAGPLITLLDTVNPLFKGLSENKTAAKALGVALVGAAGALTVMAAATGGILAKQYALAGAQNVATAAAWGQNAATNALSASYWRAQGAAVASRASSAGLTAARYAGQAAAYGSSAAQAALSTSYWRTQAAAVASRASSLGLTAARNTGRLAGLASAGAEGILASARNSAALAAIHSRAVTVASTAAKYAGVGANYALAGASGVLSGALTASATAASLLWTALGPLGLLALGITAIIAGDALGLPILDGAISGTIGMVDTLLGPLGGIEGVASAGAGALQFMAGGAEWLYNSAMGLVGGLDATQAAMLAIPGLGIAAWLFNLAGGFDTVGGAVDAVLNPVGTFWSVVNGLSSLSVSDIPLIGGALSSGPAAAGIKLLLTPLTTMYDTLTALSNLSVKDIPLIGGMLDKGIKAGQNLAEGAAQGAKGKKGLFGKATGALAGAAAQFLPSSDAQRGPLSNLSGMGAALPAMLADHARRNRGVVGNAMDALGAVMTGRLPDRLAAPAVGRPRTPTPARATAPGVPAPSVGRPRTPAATQANAPTIAAPAVERPETPQPAGASAVVNAIVDGLSSLDALLPGSFAHGDALRARVNTVVGETPRAGAFTPPTTPTIHVRAAADTQPALAAMGALPPAVEGRARLTAATDSLTAPLADAGARLRAELVAGGERLASVVGGLSLPGMDTTVGETAGDIVQQAAPLADRAVETTEQVLGVDVPDLSGVLGTLGVEQPPQAGVADPGTAGVETPAALPLGRPPRERPTPPGGFAAMTPVRRAERRESIVQGPQGPTGAAGTGPAAAGGTVAAVASGGSDVAVTAGGDPLAAQRPAEPAVGTPGIGDVEAPTPTTATEPASPGTTTGRPMHDEPGALSGTERGRDPERGRGRPRRQGRSVVIKSIDFGDVNITVPEGETVDEEALADRIQKDRRQDIDALESKIGDEVKLARDEGGAVQGDG